MSFAFSPFPVCLHCCSFKKTLTVTTSEFLRAVKSIMASAGVGDSNPLSMLLHMTTDHCEASDL